MSDLLTHVGRFELVDVDLDKEPQCESIHHDKDSLHHEGPAAFWQVASCVHATGLRCAPYVAAVKGTGPGFCQICGDYGSDVRFIEL